MPRNTYYAEDMVRANIWYNLGGLMKTYMAHTVKKSTGQLRIQKLRAFAEVTVEVVDKLKYLSRKYPSEQHIGNKYSHVKRILEEINWNINQFEEYQQPLEEERALAETAKRKEGDE